MKIREKAGYKTVFYKTQLWTLSLYAHCITIVIHNYFRSRIDLWTLRDFLFLACVYVCMRFSLPFHAKLDWLLKVCGKRFNFCGRSWKRVIFLFEIPCRIELLFGSMNVICRENFPGINERARTDIANELLMLPQPMFFSPWSFASFFLACHRVFSQTESKRIMICRMIYYIIRCS